MPQESPPSRRRFLGVTAGTIATAATAGCLGSLAGASPSNRIEPAEPSQPREGSPGEFYFFLEENGIDVETLEREDDDLYLTYRSAADTVDASNEEITIVYEIYKQALIRRESPIQFLYAEIENPFDEQALGWGVDTEWIHEFDGAAESDGESTEEPTNESVQNETAGDDVDVDAVNLWNMISNTKVYQEDLEVDDTVGGSNDSNRSNLDDRNGTVDDEGGDRNGTVDDEGAD